MASRALYPPIVDSYMPAFKAGNTSCKVYFSLSKFNGSTDFSSVHASVIKQNTGMNVVNKTDSNNKYRQTGIILNMRATKVAEENNLYYIEIEDEDLGSISGTYHGWIPGWTYKIQIRLSAKDYDGSIGQAAWLNSYASYFSEWSTVCVVKATGRIDYDIPILSIDTRDENSNISSAMERVYYSSSLELSGRFYRAEDPSELINSYQFILYDEEDNILDDSGVILTNQFQDSDSFNYTVKRELVDTKIYKLAFKFDTINYYTGGFYEFNDKVDKRYTFKASISLIDQTTYSIITADNDLDGILTDVTTVHEEEEEGRIGLKIYDPNESAAFSGNLCIRRADSKDNFQTWTDIKIITVKDELVNNLPLIYDYTAESGIWYLYGIQKMDSIGSRGVLNVMSNPIMRNYNYSFLLGKNNQQLKLMFDNTMNNFKYQVLDSKVDPISATYPVVTRNAALRYRTFPINGLISFWMDENKLFCDKKIIYKYDEVIEKYKEYNEANEIVQYDYIYEKDFRQKVLDFLYDGEIKLFKSPTEGNILVRLTDISCVPNQSLDRMIYSFTSNAYEMAECTMEKCREYGLYDIGTYSSDFATYETKIGQLQMDFPIGANVFQEIYKKYDSQGRNMAGYKKTLINISHIKITFDGPPLRIKNTANEYVSGNNFSLNGKQFTVYNPIRQYDFDSRLSYTAADNLFFLGDAEGKVSTVRATVDFLYQLSSEVYVEKKVQSREAKDGIGQLFEPVIPGTNLYREVYYKYYVNWPDTFRQLVQVPSIEIEANPGVVMAIKDINDTDFEYHDINETGQLRFFNLSNIVGIKYVGIRQEDGSIDNTKNADILLNYAYSLVEGTYQKEI